MGWIVYPKSKNPCCVLDASCVAAYRAVACPECKGRFPGVLGCHACRGTGESACSLSLGFRATCSAKLRVGRGSIVNAPDGITYELIKDPLGRSSPFERRRAWMVFEKGANLPLFIAGERAWATRGEALDYLSRHVAAAPHHSRD